MLKIRMQRTGRINVPNYRIVVLEHTRSPKAGNFVEKLGSYDPRSKQRVLDAERIKYWISKGAQPSPTVHNMLVSAKIIEGKKVNVLPRKSPPASPEAASVEAKAPEASAPAEAPAAA